MTDSQQPVGRPPVKQNEILETLREQIVNGDLPPGSRLPLRMDLQDQFNVSVSTVQSALSRLIEDGFVKPHGRRGTFVCKYPPHLCVYGLALPSRPVSSQVQSRVVTGLVKAAHKLDDGRHRQFRIYEDITGHIDSENDQHLLNDIQGHRIAGVIYAFAQPSELSGSVLTCQDAPSVLIQTHGDPAMMPRVEPDIRAFIDGALDALLEQGCRKIGVVTVTGTRPEHLKHLMAAIKSRKLHIEPRWLQCVGWPEVHWANNATQAILRHDADSRPDGLIVLDDNITADVVKGIEASGLKVPDDLAVVTHGNFPCPRPKLPIRQLCFDPRELLTAAIQSITDGLSRKRTRSVQRVSPRFREEFDCAAH